MAVKFPDTYSLYKEVQRDPIQYTYCVDFEHISRYQALRQVIHQGLSEDRYVALETSNPFSTNSNLKYYTVPHDRQNILDLIAEEQLGSANYAWVIAYVNKIADGFTVLEGTQLAIPLSISALFDKGELLASVSATKLNLGSE